VRPSQFTPTRGSTSIGTGLYAISGKTDCLVRVIRPNLTQHRRRNSLSADRHDEPTCIL
jgi:hypothetical protein